MADNDKDLLPQEEIQRLTRLVTKAVRERLERNDVGLVLIITEYGESPRVQWVSTMDRPTSITLLKSIAVEDDRPSAPGIH